MSGKLFQKVIHICAEDSPNVRYAMEEIAAGRTPTNKIVLPGVLTYGDYCQRMTTYDDVKKCISLGGRFYKGAAKLLYPPTWLDHSARYARTLNLRRQAVSMGVDTAEGGDSTVWCVVDAYGVLEILSFKTPDTSVIVGQTIGLGKKWRIPSKMWLFDRGGGGKEHVDTLRKMGYKVRTIGFGEEIKMKDRRKKGKKKQVEEYEEEKYRYKNRRAQMYGQVRELLDPANESIFAIPTEYAELRRQLAPIPLLYDREGRIYLPPKYKSNPRSNETTLVEMIGCSPDEADALVLAVHAMLHPETKRLAGAAW